MATPIGLLFDLEFWLRRDILYGNSTLSRSTTRLRAKPDSGQSGQPLEVFFVGQWRSKSVQTPFKYGLLAREM